MAKEALDKIQAELRTAIQNHQILVAKMQSDPQNPNYKKQLHDLQTEITSLDGRQKVIVQMLRKELVNKQQNQALNLNANANQTQTTKPHQQPMHQHHHHHHQQQHKHQQHVQQVQVQVQVQQPPPPLQQQQQQQQQVHHHHHHHHPHPQQQVPPPPVTVPVQPQPADLSRKTEPVKPPSILNTPPTKGAKQIILQNKNQMAPPNVLPPKRTCSEPEIKKTVEKKQPPCEEKEVKSVQNSTKKLQYMRSLDLVTPEALKEFQSKRSERKRRSTANPQFSYGLESDKKRMNYLVGSNLTPAVKRPRGRPPKHGSSPTNSRPGTPDSSDSNASYKNGILNGSTDDLHDGLCYVCQKAGRLLICDGCGMAYHPTCLDPPVDSFPNGPWRCYKCQNDKSQTIGSETLDIVHNYIMNKTAKEEEKKKLQRRNTELNNERVQLETNTKQLSQSLYQCIQKKQELLSVNKKAQQSADNITKFIQVFQS